MRHPFERWLSDQEFSDEAKGLFAEAISAYMAKAFRASFIMSYLGFMTVVRDRLLTSAAPRGVEPDRWERRLQVIRAADTWDQAVFDCVQQKDDSAIFLVPEELRRQVHYFKDRRNDCAHGKVAGIGFELVDTFWTFVRENVGRFVVNGSEEALLEELKRHFDPTFTPPGKSPDHIVNKIRAAVDPANYRDFVRQVFETLAFPENGRRRLLTPGLNHRLACLDDMVSLGITDLTRAVVDALSLHGLVSTFLIHHPERVSLFSNDQQLVRSLWKDQSLMRSAGGASVYVALLTQSLIPEDQIHESMRDFVRAISESLPAAEHRTILEQFGLREEVEHYVFYRRGIPQTGVLDEFRWANNSANISFVLSFLDVYGLTDSVCRGIAHTFSVPNYPIDLAEALNVYFASQPEKLETLKRKIEEKELPQPTYLTVVAPETEDEEGTGDGAD